MKTESVAIVGGGIVGLASAHSLAARFPHLHIKLYEKEQELATHQTGRNSGVIHSGIYYKPGSLKANLTIEGKRSLEEYCAEKGIKYDRCGKVIVATSPSEIPALETLLQRGAANGVPCDRINAEQLREIEPYATGIDGIHVHSTGIVDYVGFCKSLGAGLVERGHEIHTGAKVTAIKETSECVQLETSVGGVSADYLVNCAGLYSDKIARMSGCDPKAKIVPFRGEYFDLRPEAEKLCRNLIYPVPDPKFPFLGVHFTRMVLGGVECGPNAVLAFAREGYRKTQMNVGELTEILRYSGFLKMAGKHWRMGSEEMWRSWSKAAFLKSLQKLVKDISAEDIVPGGAGVRAQAVLPNGALVDDFLFTETQRMVHVVNAPSPAATASLAIGDHIVTMLSKHFAAKV